MHSGRERVPLSPVRSDSAYQLDVKHHYVVGEFYDWITDPRGFERLFHWNRARTVRRLIGKNDQPAIALDVGCGTGLITRYLPARRVVGLDINRWNLDRVKRWMPNSDFILCDVEHLPIRNESADLAVCTEVLEHLSRPESALAEVSRVLRDNGRLVGSVPSKSPIWSLRSILSVTHPKSEPFHHNYRRSELAELVAKFFTRPRVSYGNFLMNLFIDARSPDLARAGRSHQ